MSDESKEYIKEFVAQRVNELLTENKIKSKSTLSNLTGNSEHLISNLVNKKHNPYVASVYDVCEFFGITLSDFFRIDFSNNKSSEAMLKLLSEKYEPEDITMIYDMFDNVEPENVKAALKAFSDYHNSKTKKENEKI